MYITGAYCSPDSTTNMATTFQHTTEFFYKLTQHNLSEKVKNDLHILCGDFNSHTGQSVQEHLTQEEQLDIPPRRGYPNPHHKASPSQSQATHDNSNLRGRMFLDMFNISGYVMTNSRFESLNSPTIPATFVRDRSNNTNNIITRTIVDYFTLHKSQLHTVSNCTIHTNSQQDLMFNPA